MKPVAAGTNLPPAVRTSSLTANRVGSESISTQAESLSFAQMVSALEGLSVSYGQRRMAAYVRISSTLSIEAFPEAMTYLKTRSEHEQLSALLFERWGAVNPEAAMGWAEGIAQKSQNQRARLAILRGWAERDPEAAVAWARKATPGIFCSAGS